jgi:hypothetical protein
LHLPAGRVCHRVDYLALLITEVPLRGRALAGETASQQPEVGS